MVKQSLFLLFLLCWIPAQAADDLTDAKTAFATYQNYQKTDDLRTLDLFSTNCVVIFTITDGKTQKVLSVPAQVFRETLKKAIAQKRGSDDIYEDVKYSSDGFSVRVNATMVRSDSGKRGPFSALYERDTNGVFKIVELKLTVFDDGHPSSKSGGQP